MLSFNNFILEQKRNASEIKSDEISLFVSSMQNLVSKYRRSSIKAADIWHDSVMTGKFIEWLESNAEPLWEKYGYPTIGSHGWGLFEQEIITKYLR